MPDTSPTQPSGLRLKLRALVRELGKFGTVGAVAFTVDSVLYALLLRAGIETLIAKTVATVIATTVAFAGNRFWTWRDRAHTNMARQYTTFFVLNAVGLGLALSCLAISHYGLGQIWPALQTPLADLIASQLVGNALGTLFRFWSYRRFVFPTATTPAGRAPRQSPPAEAPPDEPPAGAPDNPPPAGVTSPPSPRA